MGVMMRYFLVTLLCLLTVFSRSDAYIGWATSMRQVVEYFEDTGPETLAIFDIDLVLLQPAHPAFQEKNMFRYTPVVKKFIKELGRDHTSIFFNLVNISYDSVLVDERTPYLLEGLKNGEVPTIALTGRMVGPLGEVANLERWSETRLKEFGIDFSTSAPEGEWDFQVLPQFRGCAPRYHHGILYTNGHNCSKGELLIAFLKETGMHPARVVFIDDREYNLHSVEEALNAFDPHIVFYGIHFIGAQYCPTEELSEEEFSAHWQAMASRAASLE